MDMDKISKKLSKLNLLLKLHSIKQNVYLDNEHRKLHSFLVFTLRDNRLFHEQSNTINALLDSLIEKIIEFN